MIRPRHESDHERFFNKSPAEIQLHLMRWQLVVSVMTLLLVLVITIIVGVVAGRLMHIASTASKIEDAVYESGVIDNMSLMLNDVWFTVYPRIREGVSLGYNLVQSANNNNITALINGLVGDASNIGRFVHTILNLAANQYVAQQQNP